MGIGFAVPASTAQRIVDELLANGRATHPWIGAQTAQISQDTADRFSTVAGLFVQEVTAGGPAASAGLQVGDVITRINDQAANSVSLAWLLVSAKVGDEVAIDYSRDGTAQHTTLTLAEQP
ncbi:MAG: S1C family serine protease [Propionicimonas sp.]|uniref:S1C family serine protease n=1 Tax=Propionicimonas sp. TaxID=1955623 RepID=UPI003D0F5C61